MDSGEKQSKGKVVLNYSQKINREKKEKKGKKGEKGNSTESC